MPSSSNLSLWSLYRRYRFSAPVAGLVVDISRVRFDPGYLLDMRQRISSALDAMESLEAGAIANPTEGRRVGHYWLRAPERAPDDDVTRAILDAQAAVTTFAAQVRGGRIRGTAGRLRHCVHVGIGGSAVGPQLACAALDGEPDGLDVHFLDNADPDGVDRLLARLDGELDRTLVSVVSKSGWTPTPRFLQRELELAYERSGLDFAAHAVATTMQGSELDEIAKAGGWLARFPLWDWVGGRTSITSAVGLLPMALRGVDTAAFLRGAAAVDDLTRRREPTANPAAALALMWYRLGDGHGGKRMVILPYKDRLASFPRYAQQLIMESVGKRHTRHGETVQQGFTVYGHKGVSDQHSYLQQLTEGTPDFFVTFIGIREHRAGRSPEVEPGVTLGDQLFASLEATRDTLFAGGRDSITITLADVGPEALGALVALYERAVGLYAELIDVNAYDQPGVNKEMAAPVLELLNAAMTYLRKAEDPQTATRIAAAIDRPEQVETLYKLLEQLAADPDRRVTMLPADEPFEERFALTR
jgi:glucose-6-phosphate isomerase